MRLLPIAACLAAILSGCASLVPPTDLSAPLRDIPERWSGLALRAEDPPATRWWAQAHDPLLAELVAAGVQGSPTIAEATARLVQARHQAAGAWLGTTPSAGLSATPLQRGNSTGTSVKESRSAGLSVAREANLFGKALLDGQVADLKADVSAANLQFVQLAVAADIGAAYVNYRACTEQHDLTLTDLKSRQRIGRVIGAKVALGAAPPADAERQRASEAEGESQLETVAGICERAVNQLVALTGMTREDLLYKLTADTTKPKLLPPAIPSLPADVIRKRPDVQAAEANLTAAAVSIGAAKADFAPRLSLAGTLGSLASGPIGTLSTAAATWTFAANLTAPLWDSGVRRTTLRIAEARYDELLATYQGTVRSAVREVEDTLSRVRIAQRQESAMKAAATGFDANFKTMRARYDAGLTARIELEEARRSWLSSQLAVTNNWAEQQQAAIALYRATAAGWVPDTESH